MATNYGVNATKRANQTIKDLEPQGEHKSPLLIAYDSFVMTAAMAQNDTIRFMKLPPKCRVIDVHFAITVSMDAAAGTADIGWEASVDYLGATVDAASAAGFMTAVDCTAAATFIMADDQGTTAGNKKQFGDAEVQVTFKATHSGGLDATTGACNITVFYTVS
jgi:hypothetical protein